MQPLEEIRKLHLNRTAAVRHFGSSDSSAYTNLGPISRAISALVGPVSWTIEGGAWHFWKSEEQPVKASQHLSQRKNWSNGGRRVGWVGNTILFQIFTSTDGVCSRVVVDMHAKVFHSGSGS